ncbi:hypothetical protein KEJ18_03610 [Candidatus Bathyarchaeota archaeon]|nr:hypothetical protein [Candidatus Bathyarchaeota archaeon]
MGFPEEGQVIDGFTVESVSVSHVGVSAGRYEYPFEIIVKGEGNINKVKATFKAFFKTRRTVFSGYGNPYQCHHGKMEIKELRSGRFSITSRGTCVRVYLKDELERFAEHLSQKGLVINNKDETEWIDIIAEYMKQYKKTSSRKTPVFG